jgi:Uma2 family endonuclease
MSRVAATPLSLEGWLALPEMLQPCEVVDGQPVVTAAPLGLHQRIVYRLALLLGSACPPGCEVLTSPVDWVLRVEPLLVRQPDVVVVSHELAETLPLRQPPLLAVEVVSAGSFERDVVTSAASTRSRVSSTTGSSMPSESVPRSRSLRTAWSETC